MDTNTRAVDVRPENDAHDANARQHGAKALHQSKDKLLLDLKAVVDDAQALIKETVDSSAESVAGVPAYLDDRLSAAKDGLQRVKGVMAAKAKQATATTDQYVRENPWRSIGLFVGAGVVPWHSGFIGSVLQIEAENNRANGMLQPRHCNVAVSSMAATSIFDCA